jgi:hypothetical protein
MARGRFITNEIARDKAINDLSDDTSRLAFTWLITFADAEGRTYGDPAIILSMLFPRRRDVSFERMAYYLKEWQDAGLVRWYEANGDQWVEFPSFDKHQAGIRKDREAKSVIPPSTGVPPSYKTGTPEQLPTNSGVTPEKPGLTLTLINGEAEVNANGGVAPAPAALITDRDAERMFCEVTNFVSIPPGELKRLDQIIGFIRAYGWDTTKKVMTTVFQGWVKTPRKNGTGNYSSINFGWVDRAQEVLAGYGIAITKDPMQMTHDEFIAYYQKKAEEETP